ncbi:HAD family hydrolase [Methylobrevis pamukkalensis]|uniref:phosphoglycolate phosphatase n=1 Tax=Methylobrevis pamukkalensis TaxID=1439726 RepID=A0A1E3H1D3_9HYPH|nr:HAD family phosphatase [Methylobrevis pamukkalensis]ODN69945.1 Phosphorylated carbohydrates phosphatase [Methylobrevis pamukkalensis]
MTIRAVAWDIDGTLVDSEPHHHDALRRVSARYGVTVAPVDPEHLGVSMDAVWDYFRGSYPEDLTQDVWLEEIVTEYLAGVTALTPFDGVVATMEALKAAGIRQCCVSNSYRRIVDANLAALGILHLIDFSVSRDDVSIGKPDPEPYRLACERFGLAPQEVLAVEDSRTGVASAKAAGLVAIHISVDLTDRADVLRHAGIAAAD